MREIKFRGKRVDNGEWAYGYYVYSLAFDEHWISEKMNFENREIVRTVDAQTVGQYTGRIDKQGYEIYEGDINQDGGLCAWCEDDASFIWEYKDIEAMPMEGEYSWCEIKGNIHETFKQ